MPFNSIIQDKRSAKIKAYHKLNWRLVSIETWLFLAYGGQLGLLAENGGLFMFASKLGLVFSMCSNTVSTEM